MPDKPNWTIFFNIDCGDFIGTAWEFYIKNEEAERRYSELTLNDKFCATKRPYFHSVDKHHLGAAHFQLQNS